MKSQSKKWIKKKKKKQQSLQQFRLPGRCSSIVFIASYTMIVCLTAYFVVVCAHSINHFYDFLFLFFSISSVLLQHANQFACLPEALEKRSVMFSAFIRSVEFECWYLFVLVFSQRNTRKQKTKNKTKNIRKNYKKKSSARNNTKTKKVYIYNEHASVYFFWLWLSIVTEDK